MRLLSWLPLLLPPLLLLLLFLLRCNRCRATWHISRDGGDAKLAGERTAKLKRYVVHALLLDGV